jgi:hypothetical protein
MHERDGLAILQSGVNLAEQLHPAYDLAGIWRRDDLVRGGHDGTFCAAR